MRFKQISQLTDRHLVKISLCGKILGLKLVNLHSFEFRFVFGSQINEHLRLNCGQRLCENLMLRKWLLWYAHLKEISWLVYTRVVLRLIKIGGNELLPLLRCNFISISHSNKLTFIHLSACELIKHYLLVGAQCEVGLLDISNEVNRRF